MFVVLAALQLAVVPSAARDPQSAQPTIDSLATTHVVGAPGARIDSLLRGFAERGFAGTVLVVRDRQIVLLKGYGEADPERGIRNLPATRFEMNSITKMFTAAAILQLAANGQLDVADPLEKYLGAFPASKREATIEHLASHTSGLAVQGAPLVGATRDAFVASVKRAPREAPPGTQYRYTNAGYSLLAAVIERVSGQSYEDYLREHIFAPAGMRTAVFRDEVPPDDPRFAHGRAGQGGPYLWGTRGAGGVWSTVGDIYRWVVAVEDSVGVPASMRPLLFTRPTPPSEEMYGWHVRRTQIDKGGGSADFASQLLYYPSQRVVIIWGNNDLRQTWRHTLNRGISDRILR